MDRFNFIKKKKYEIIFDTILLILTISLFVYDDQSRQSHDEQIEISKNTDPTFYISTIDNPPQKTYCYQGTQSNYDQYLCYKIVSEPLHPFSQTFQGPLDLSYIDLDNNGNFTEKSVVLQDKEVLTINNYKVNLTLCDLVQIRASCITGKDTFYIVSQTGLTNAYIKFTSSVQISRSQRSTASIFVSSIMVFALLVITMRFYTRERKRVAETQNETVYKKERNFLIDLETGTGQQGEIRSGDFRISF